MLALLNVVLGGALLVVGRKLFWLFVAGIGFVTGILLVNRFFHGSELITILAGLVLGVIFALLAIFLELIAIGIAGFLGGGYVFLSLASVLGLDKGIMSAIAFILGGIIGVVLIAVLFDWALISISSLAGAAMIVGAIRLTPSTASVVFIVLLLAGVLIQGTELRKNGPEAGA